MITANEKTLKEIAYAEGLDPQYKETTLRLVETWAKHSSTNKLRDVYYNSDNPTKDLGVSVSPDIAKKLKPHIDWAAKCVNWWADHVQFERFTADDEQAQQQLEHICRLNDINNLVRKVVQSSLCHSVAFLTVTKGNEQWGEPSVVISGYPATAASAVYSNAKKRITAGLVVADSTYDKTSRTHVPSLLYMFDDECTTVLTRSGKKWAAQTNAHNMGRVPMEHLSYHATLERPFGSSRISRTVMSLVDDAQRELMNMAACAAFSAAPQKFLLGTDPETGKKMSKTKFENYIGSLLMVTKNTADQIPQFGQLAQLQMQPHSDYIRTLAGLFSDATGVPLSSLGFSSTNPTSADAILANQEDAIIDISNYIEACKHSLVTTATMAIGQAQNISYIDVRNIYDISAIFANPSTPSPVSMSDAVQKRVASFPWMAYSDVVLRDLGYKGAELKQLQQDRKKQQGARLIEASLQASAKKETEDGA